MTVRGAGDPGGDLREGGRALVSDVDGTLLDAGEPSDGAAELGARLRQAGAELVLSSGRGLELSLEAAAALRSAGLPRPAALVCGVGSEVYLAEAGGYVLDGAWAGRLAATGFDAGAVRAALSGVAGLELQPEAAQGEFKVSFFVPPHAGGPTAPDAASATLAARGLGARLVYSAGQFLDVLPEPASKGGALLHLVERFGLPPAAVVVAGDSGNDRELLLTGAERGMVAVLVANHEPELEDMRSHPGVYLASRPHCAGVLEGLERAGW